VDFVIVGFLLGSLFLLLGIAARDLGPRLLTKPQPTTSLSGDPAALPAPQVELWRKLTPLAGSTIMIGGGVIILATLAGIFLQASDSQGSRLVLGAFLIAVVGIVARLPFLARARPKVAKPKVERPKVEQRRPAPVRERPRPARPLRPTQPPAEMPQPVRRRPAPEPAPSYQLRKNGNREEVPEQAAASAFPDLPDIFDSDEPIQTGLLEKLLAEDDQRSRSTTRDDQTLENDGSRPHGDSPNQSVSERSAR
jgi:hypothetical protein